jgi:hypothetical protein
MTQTPDNDPSETADNTPSNDATPDWETPCVNCGTTPTVTITSAGNMIHHTQLCGPCCWGEADTLDPSNW